MSDKKEFTEKDWKLFRSQIGTWQEKYMERLNKEYIELLSQDKLASDKFWELEKRIKKDKRSKGVLIDMRRSTMIFNVLDLITDEVITLDDLNEFSDIFKESINNYLEMRKRYEHLTK